MKRLFRYGATDLPSLLAVLLLAVCLLSPKARATEPPHVLVLNSYHKGYHWTDNMVASIEGGFAEKDPDAVLSIEYMDSKRVAPTKAYFDMLAELYAAKYATHPPELIIVTDNNALTFMIDYHEQLFTGVPIVFCGVNNFRDEMLRGDPLVTGVVEVPDITGTIELMLDIHPATERIYVICDDTPTGRQNAEMARNAIRNFKDIEFVFLSGSQYTFTELLGRLETLEPTSLGLFFDMFRDRTGEYFSAQPTVRAVTDASSRPVYTHIDMYVGWGVVGGKVAAARLQGETAARQAMEILRGTPASKVPIIRECPTMCLFDQRVMDRYGIEAGQLPPGSTIIHQRISFYQRYKMLVWAVSVALFTLAAISVGLSISIARRYRAERELRQQRRLLSDVLTNIPHHVFWKDREGQYQGCNAKAAEFAVMGDIAEVVGKHDAELPRIAPWAEEFAEKTRRIVETGEPLINEEKTLALPDGSTVVLLTSIVPMRSDRGEITGVLGVSLDITERKQLEQQLSDSEKMRALGQLAGGIAHDFNNILVAVQGNAELLISSLPTGSDNAELAKEILNAAQRAADLTRKLLGFARRRPMEATNVNLHDIIGDIADLLTHSIDRRISIDCRLEADHADVHGDPSQLHSAVLNLAVNARDAMADGGSMTFHTRNIHSRHLTNDYDGEVSNGNCIEITVADTGTGIDEAILPHIFEPFFTTKKTGAGTGLGLAAVYGCVRSHHGSLRVESSPGAGTAFSIVLPVADELMQPTPAPRSTPQRGEGRLMLLDDEESVRHFACRALQNLGYDVVAHADATEGLAWFREHHASLNAVVLDMIMPKMTGSEVLREMRQTDPNIPVVLFSGYSQTNVGELLKRYKRVAFLPKPFAIEDLARTVADLIRPVE